LIAPLEQISKTEAAPNDSVSPGVRAEAVAGFEPKPFEATKAAMALKGPTKLHDVVIDGASVQSAALPVGKAPLSEKQQPDGAQTGVIEPKDTSRFKTPVIPGPGGSDEPMDEHGNRSGDSPDWSPDLPPDHVQTGLGSNGKPKSIVSTEDTSNGDVKTTFDFDEGGKVTSRTVDSPDGKYVVQYDPNGKATSGMFTKSGSTTPEATDVDPNDKVTVKSDASSRQTSISSDDGNVRMGLSLDGEGKVKSRTIDTDAQHVESQFDSDGRDTYDQTTNYGTDGQKSSRHTSTDDYSLDETFHKGEVVKSEENSRDYYIANEKLADGSTLATSESDGVVQNIKTLPDGTRLEHATDGETTKNSITNPDGSSNEIVDSHENVTVYRKNPQGFWQADITSKQGGVETRVQGGPNDTLMDRLGLDPKVITPI